jgi:hypothetical protein
MSEPINTLIFPSYKIESRLIESIILHIINNNYFKKPLYIIPKITIPAFIEFEQYKIPQNKLNVNFSDYRVPDNDILIYSQGINNIPNNYDLFYEPSDDRQNCDIGTYYIKNIMKYSKDLWIDYFVETMNEPDKLINSNLLIFFTGKTAPYTQMIIDSVFYKNISKFCLFEVHERNM